MTTSDGYIIGTTKIVDHGSDSLRYTIVLVSEGYRSSEISKFHNDAQDFVNKLYNTPPFDELFCGINIQRMDVVSTNTGADDPVCGGTDHGTGSTVSTYFDATFCGDSTVRRLLTVNHTTLLSKVASHVSRWNLIVVLVNTTQYGGSGSPGISVFSTDPSWLEVAMHEIGHSAFNFADEYEYLQGCNTVPPETGHDNFTDSEPMKPNVTKNTNRTTNKWRDLILPSTNMPTTSNADCSHCDPQASPVPSGTVGTFEGANYFHCGCYRPEFNCKMRALSNPYCSVCTRVIRQTLQTYLPAESITLATPSINFQNIPEGFGGTGVTTYRAIVFNVVSCRSLTFRIISGPTGGFGTPLGTLVVLPSNETTPIGYARIWLAYTSTHSGSSSSGTVRVRCDQTGHTYTINIHANTVARHKSAIVMVLDHSGSMAEDAGDGTTKVQKLREAANIFVNAMLQGDGIGIVRFDNASQRLMNIIDVGPPVIGAGRISAIGHISGTELDPAGATSIGAGVLQGKQALTDAQTLASPPYDVLAMLVLTDGVENTPPMLSTVGSSITSNTFAIGLGMPYNISVSALNALTQGHNGYLLVTGSLTPDQSARLNKYFLQILAGITNANVVLDPHGELSIGEEHAISFTVSEADMGIDVYLLCPLPDIIEFYLDTPDGHRIDLSTASSLGNVEFIIRDNIAYYRISLPAIPEDPEGSHAGTWRAILKLNESRQISQYLQKDQIRDAKLYEMLKRGIIPYDLVVHCYSNLTFKVNSSQTSFEPGAEVKLFATLNEYDVPVEKRAKTWAEISLPNGSKSVIYFNENEPGIFGASFDADMSGLYTIRVRAHGETFYGSAFDREQTITAAVYPGGDKSPDVNTNDILCNIIGCISGEDIIGNKLFELLYQIGIDPKKIMKCISQYCDDRSGWGEKHTSKNT